MPGRRVREPDLDRSTLMLNYAKVGDQVYLHEVRLMGYVLTAGVIASLNAIAPIAK